MSVVHLALAASPSPALCLQMRPHRAAVTEQLETLTRWRPKKRQRRDISNGRSLLGDFAAASSASSSSASSSSPASSSLAAAASAALARSLYPDIVNDPFALLLAEAAGTKGGGGDDGGEGAETETKTSTPRSAFSAAAAAFADAALLSATGLVNFEADPKGSEYRQVVLLGPGLDSRPQRLAWLAGTILFECATADAHAVAAAALASERAKELAAAAAAGAGAAAAAEGGQSGEPFSAFNGSGAPRGRLLRRVVCDASTEQGREALGEALLSAGFRAERLSAWCVSAGALDFDPSPPSSSPSTLTAEALGQLFGAVASCAAFCSFVVGDLPPMTRGAAESAVASSGLLGSVVAFGSSSVGGGDAAGSRLWRRNGWRAEGGDGGGGEAEEDGGSSGQRRRRRECRWLFIGQQRSRSDAELGILEAFGEAAEEAEGFEDNVS